MTEIIYTSKGIKVGDQEIDLEFINEMVTLKRVKSEDLALMVIKWPSTRGFDGIEEKIVASRDFLNKVASFLVGKMIYFGEINGKHSDVHGDIEKDEITISNADEDVVEFIKQNPSRRRYEYSFINKFCEREDEDPSLDEDEIQTFLEICKLIEYKCYSKKYKTIQK